MVLLFGGQKFHSAAHAEWGVHFWLDTGNLKRLPWVHGTAVPVLFTRGTTAVLFSRGTTAPVLHPVRSGALALGGGLALGCTERGPPPPPRC